jgi:hypothetical protein
MENTKAQIRIELVEGDKKVSTSMYLENYSKLKFLHNIHLGDDMIESLIQEFNNQKNIDAVELLHNIVKKEVDELNKDRYDT